MIYKIGWWNKHDNYYIMAYEDYLNDPIRILR